MTKIIDGKALAAQVRDDLRERVSYLQIRYGQVPRLVVILVGHDPASEIYVRNKMRTAETIGIDSHVLRFEETITEKALLNEIQLLNRDNTVDAILVQLPLPAHINPTKVINKISVHKDVDGFNPRNVSKLWLGEKGIIPCTPKGIMKLIATTGVQIEGALAVVIGRSNIVGKPIAKLLLDANATVVMAHSRTKDLQKLTRQADILVVAIGSPHFIKAEDIKSGAVVIDVGISRGEDGLLYGDVNTTETQKQAGWITPVPGGVGPMTIAMLMENTIACFEGKHA